MDDANSSKLNWSKIIMDGVLPIDGHCCCVVDEKLYIFGGVQHTKYDFHESDTMFLACPISKQFGSLKVSGNIPKSRSSSSMVAVGKKLYLFGGLNSTCGWLDDFHVFDTETNTWHLINSVGQKPSPRDKLASAVVGNRIFYFGGFGPLNEAQVERALHKDESSDEDSDDEDDDDQSAKFGWFNDTFVFDTTTNAWFKIPHYTSDVPSPRAACSMCAIEESILVFGGRDKDGRCNDLYAFDTRHLNWKKVEAASGLVPEPRSFHASVAVGNRMVVVGGMSRNDEHFADVHVFDAETLCWSQPKVSDGFSGRGCHTLSVVRDGLVLFGGSGNFSKERSQCDSFFNEFLLLPISSLVDSLEVATKITI